MRRWREAAAILLAAALFIGLTYGAAGRLLPLRLDHGCNWENFAREEPDSLDVLFLGSSLVYCDVIPAVVWEESGLTSYVMAGPVQLLPITYQVLRYVCRTQSPQVVVVELNGLFVPRYARELKPNLLYMPWSEERVLATLRSAVPEERLEMFFPLYGDHDRIYSVSLEELSREQSREADVYAGYTLLTDGIGPNGETQRDYDVDWDTFRADVGYLRKLSDFCAQRDMQLVFYFAPALSPLPQAERDAVKKALEDVPHALFFDCNEADGSWPVFDPRADWYDPRHLNLYGAEPFSRRLAQELQTLDLETRHPGYDALWQERYAVIREKLDEARPAG